MSTIGLYHPFIHFKDDEWLKLSALYWDRMARIVPSSYWTGQSSMAIANDSPTTRELIDKLGYVVNIHPTEASYPVSDTFAQLLTKHAAELRNHYDVRHADRWPIDSITMGHAQFRNPHLAYVNMSKLRKEFAEQLQEEHLAQVDSDQEVDPSRKWIGMHPRLATVYMATLAEEVAVVNRLTPAAAETVDHVAALGWGQDRVAAALLGCRALLGRDHERGPDLDDEDDTATVDPEVPATLGLLAVRAIVPKDPTSLTVDKIVAIRNDFGEELFKLQEFIKEFANQRLSDLNEAEAAPQVVRTQLEVAYENEIRPMVGELKRALRGHGIDTVETALGTSITMPNALSGIPVDNPVAFGAAAVLSLVPALRAKRREALKAYYESPVGYLFRLEQELQPHTLIARIGQRIRSFVTGV